jgi:uncharacterized protein (DUF305 family)
LVALLAACGRGAASPLPAEHPSGVNDADVGFLQTLTGTRFDLGLLTMMRTHHAGAVELAETELRAGASAEAKELARKVIGTRQPEIRQMQRWQDAWA